MWKDVLDIYILRPGYHPPDKIMIWFELPDLERLRLQQLEEKPSVQSPVVNTIFSFVDRQRTKEVTSESTTDTALAELYAQVQAMPESAQKRRLITKLNDANGCGTPKIKKTFISKTKKEQGQ